MQEGRNRVSLDVGSQVSRVMVWVESSQNCPSLSSRAVVSLCLVLAILKLCVWTLEIEVLVTRAECTRVYTRAGRGENDRAVGERDPWLDAGLLFISLGPS